MPVANDGYGLRIVERNEADPRRWYYRFATDSIGWTDPPGPAVYVQMPEDYHTSGRSYPVLYLLHGGNQDFRTFDGLGIRAWTAGLPIIVVMPDGGRAGWYSNPVSSLCVPPARNWEHFHMAQLLRWIEANFRTYAEFEGRAVSGFSMGGFGALKYAAKYYGHFASVSSHSGPASLRRDLGIVARWANLTSGAVELCGGTIYGEPFDQARMTADNPVQNIESYRNKRIFLVAGTSPDPVDLFSFANESVVLPSQREFRGLLKSAGIAHEWHERSGGHIIREDMMRADLRGIVGRLRPAASMVNPPPAGTYQGCPSGAVGIYSQNAGWNNGNPSDTYYAYGPHNLVNQFGMHRIFNNQTGGATVRVCTGYNGAGRQGYLPAGWYMDLDLTPINSITLEP